jgi:ABC-type Fe3+ transport system substrate-binding protein
VKYYLVIVAAVVLVALPFLLRKSAAVGDWRAGDPVLVILSPHNEAIRYEFSEGFSRWHRAQYGRPVKVDWRVIGGTTEIMRYLASEYVGSMRGFWQRRGERWPSDGAELILDRAFRPDKPPAAAATNAWLAARFAQQKQVYQAFRGVDDPAAVTCGVDLFFGGGSFDHDRAARQGLCVAPWSREESQQPDVAALLGAFPSQMGGETWRSEVFFGTVLSSFGICSNPERLRELGVPDDPVRWLDLADPRLVGQVGLADPTKSGSVAKAFEMIIHEQCWQEVLAAGFTREMVASNESVIALARLPPGVMPPGVPPEYQAAVARGWLAGVNLVRRIGANAHYFTDGAGKVPMDVCAGVVATGVAIDFYGRFQAETERAPNGAERMRYVTPHGGSSVSADPVSLLRGAPHRELAVRFIRFALSVEGQQLWNYRPGTPGGPRQYALRRLPIRREFYPASDPTQQAVCASHRPYLSDDLTDPAINPYVIGAQFTYQARWTGAHFSMQRDLVRAMCLDAGDELRAAWRAILAHGGPERNPQAMALLLQLPDQPVALNWSSALTTYQSANRQACLREWTAFFRKQYVAARAAAEGA